MDSLEIIIIALLVIILAIVLAGHIIVISKIVPSPLPPRPQPGPAPQPLIGGCAGTRYGCCPNSQIPKLNEIGSNCRY